MGKDRHNRNRRAANRRQHNRAKRANRTNPSNRNSTTSVGGGVRFVAPLTPLSIPWSAPVIGLDPSDRAGDGTTCLLSHDTPGAAFAIFDSRGVLREFLMVIEEDDLGDIDQAFLEDFFIERQALGDPAMAGIALVRTALPSEPREGSGSLHYWSYEPFDHAPDGSHSVLARDREGCRTLMVINHAGQPIDGMDVEPLMNGAGDAVYLEQYAELMERRQAVGDPSFAPMFAEYPGSPDDDVVA